MKNVSLTFDKFKHLNLDSFLIENGNLRFERLQVLVAGKKHVRT